MPTLPQPSQVINCTNLASCFQALYNFLFAIFIALAFLNFLYGAFLYLLSGGGIFKKDEGKGRMINSIIAVIVALIIPIFLNMINPGIFQVVLQIPEVKVTTPKIEYLGVSSGNLPPPPGANATISGSIQNNVILLKQNDPNFKDIPYGCSQIGPSGCGIVSLAMAILYCNGNQYDIDYTRNLIQNLASYSASNGYFLCQQGTAHGLFSANDFLRQYNVEGTPISDAISYLQQGMVVITGFYGKFTGFGYDSHIVLLTGYQDGKFLVNDPGPLDVKEISAKEASGHIVSMTAIRCLR
jgi:hypothetical protein